MTLPTGYNLFSSQVDAINITVPTNNIPLPNLEATATGYETNELIMATFAAGSASAGGPFNLTVELWGFWVGTSRKFTSQIISSRSGEAVSVAFTTSFPTPKLTPPGPVLIKVLWYADRPDVQVSGPQISLNGAVLHNTTPSRVNIYTSTFAAPSAQPITSSGWGTVQYPSASLSMSLKDTQKGGNVIVLCSIGGLETTNPKQSMTYRMRLRQYGPGSSPSTISYFRNWDPGVFAQQEMNSHDHQPMIVGGFFMAAPNSTQVIVELQAESAGLSVAAGASITLTVIQEIDHAPGDPHLLGFGVDVADYPRQLPTTATALAGAGTAFTAPGMMQSIFCFGGPATPPSRAASNTSIVTVNDGFGATLVTGNYSGKRGPVVQAATHASWKYAVSTGSYGTLQAGGESTVIPANTSVAMVFLHQPG